MQVGEPYVPGVKTWPERAEYTFSNGSHWLRLFRAGIGEEERRRIAEGPGFLGFVVEGPAIVVVYQFEGMPGWGDAPLSWHLVPEGERTIPPPLVGEAHALVRILLVDAATGLVAAIRVASLVPIVSRALEATIAAQARAPWDRAAFERALADLYRRYPSGADLRRAVRGLSVLGD